MNFSRRKVLKALGIGTGAALLAQLPGSVGASPFRLSPAMDILYPGSVRILLIGAGKRGSRFGRYALAHPEILSLSAIAEPMEARNQQIARDHGIAVQRQFSDWETALQGPKCADIALITAADDYYQPCVAALQAGYDVWLDKPASMDPALINAVNELAEAKGRSIHYCYFWERRLHFMKHILQHAKVQLPEPAGV